MAGKEEERREKPHHFESGSQEIRDEETWRTQIEDLASRISRRFLCHSSRISRENVATTSSI